MTRHFPPELPARSTNVKPTSLVGSVFWSWLGLVSTIVSGLVLTPYVIKSVGARDYGLWALVFAISESAWLFDFGIRSATAHFVSRAYAQRAWTELGETISAGVAFFAVAGLMTALAAIPLSSRVADLFNVPEQSLDTFTKLLQLVVCGWIWNAGFVSFEAALEGLGKFATITRIVVGSSVVRVVGSIVVLRGGGGILELGWVTIVIQCSASFAAFVYVRRILPGVQLSLTGVRRHIMLRSLRYGGPALVVAASNRVIANGGLMVAAHYFPPEQVAYLAVPLRMTQFMIEPIQRIGTVIRYRVAGLATSGSEEMSSIASLVSKANRFSAILACGAAVAVLPYATEALRLWSTADIAIHSQDVLQLLLCGSVLGIGVQFCSGTALFGLGRHNGYSIAIASQAVVGLVAMALLAPHAGISGMAAALAVTGFVVRGFLTPFLLCRELKTPFWPFITGSLFKPLLVAAVVLVGELWWIQLSNAQHMSRFWMIEAAIGGMIYLVGCFAYCIDSAVKQRILSAVLNSKIVRRRK